MSSDYGLSKRVSRPKVLAMIGNKGSKYTYTLPRFSPLSVEGDRIGTKYGMH